MENEKRLIDANALKFHYAKMLYPGGKASNGYRAFVTSVEVKDAPTVDAVEVVHAQWLYDGGSGCYFCSACDEYAIVQLHRDWDGTEYYEECLTNYCPNCGAKMDGDGNG